MKFFTLAYVMGHRPVSMVINFSGYRYFKVVSNMAMGIHRLVDYIGILSLKHKIQICLIFKMVAIL